MKTRSDYDVLIAGGGMVGATLACALGGSRLRVGVIEHEAPHDVRADDPLDLRISAITAATQHIFNNLGAWDGITARRVSPYREMRVWDAAGSGAIHFDAADIGLPFLGHIIENSVIQRALWDRLAAHDNVEQLCPAAHAGYQVEDDAVQVQLDGGLMLRARLLVGADGARSRVRELAGITTQGWDYAQQAVVATVRTSESHRETAWQLFLSDGPLAFLPLRDGQCSIVWSTSPRHAMKLVNMAEGDFLHELEQSLGGALGRMESCGPRAAFPLRLQHADTYARPRIALIGDAAHTIHPLAGQGVNLGLLDAAVLAEVLLAGGGDVGRYGLLRRYERARKGPNLLMMAAMDGFKRLFGTEQAGAVWARNAGLKLTNAVGPLKNLIAEHAMGLRGELPELARGELGVLGG